MFFSDIMKIGVFIKINEQLLELYNGLDILTIIDNFNNNLENEDDGAVYPLLLKSYEEYETADIKVMIFGKENNGWEPYPEEIGENGVDIA